MFDGILTCCICIVESLFWYLLAPWTIPRLHTTLMQTQNLDTILKHGDQPFASRDLRKEALALSMVGSFGGRLVVNRVDLACTRCKS